MSIRLPVYVKLTRRALERRDGLFAPVLRAAHPAADPAFAVHAFAFKNDERGFARALLSRRTEIWLFRANQRAFCGDFLAVDMSSPRASERRAFVLELKLGAPLRVGSGGVQIRNAGRALRDLAGASGILGDPSFEVLTGDAAAILDLFGRPRDEWSLRPSLCAA